jgi:hypothetical protein
VTLTELIARKTTLPWFESVAIVQELCATAIARGPAEDPRIPEPAHVALTPTGGVELLGRGPTQRSAVYSACLVLLELTPEARLPRELRLLVLAGLAPSTHLHSLAELHAELEFFERPNRRNVIRGVCEQFHSEPAPSAAGTMSRQAPPERPPSPESRLRDESAAPRSDRGGGGRKSAGDVLRIGVTALIVLAAVWLWQRPEAQWLRSGVAEIGRTALAASRDFVREALAALASLRR